MSALPPEHHLPLDRVVEMRGAYLSGVSRGTPPNTHITINFREMRGSHPWPTGYHSMTGEQKANAVADCRNRIFASLRNWCNRQEPPVPFSAVYVLENDPTGGMGPHVHILMHLPYPASEPPEPAVKPPSSRYEELTRSLYGNIRKAMGWTTRALKSKLRALEAERERLRLAEKSVKSVFLPFYLSPSKDAPGGPLSDAEQNIRLAYMAKGLRDTEVVTVSGVTQTIAQHIQQGAKITIEPAGDVRVAKRAGSLGVLAPASRIVDEAAELACKDMTWLDRRATHDALMARTQAALAAADERKAAIPEVPVIDPTVIPWHSADREKYYCGPSCGDVAEFDKSLHELAD